MAPATYAALQQGNRAIKLKHCISKNYGASSKPGTASVTMRGTEAQFGGLSQDSAYVTAKTWSEAVGGIISFGMSLGLLYPGDFTAWIMLRLLQDYMFLQHIKPKERVAILTSFFNKVRSGIITMTAITMKTSTMTMTTMTKGVMTNKLPCPGRQHQPEQSYGRRACGFWRTEENPEGNFERSRIFGGAPHER